MTFDWYSFRQSQKMVEHGVVQGGNLPAPPPPPQHLPSTRVPLLFVSERICTSKNPLAVVACEQTRPFQVSLCRVGHDFESCGAKIVNATFGSSETVRNGDETFHS